MIEHAVKMHEISLMRKSIKKVKGNEYEENNSRTIKRAKKPVL